MAKRQAAASEHHIIVSLEVTGGLLKGLKLEFADGLNTIIGGRGTGKTSIIAVIRYVLSSVGIVANSRLSELIKHALGTGRARLRIRTKHGVEYIAERMWSDTTQVLDLNGEPKAIALDRDLVFAADIYSQSEIEAIATDPKLQLALLDRHASEEIQRLEAEIRTLRGTLTHNASDFLRIDREMREFQERAEKADAFAETMKGLEEAGGPDAKKLTAAHELKARREKERKTLESITKDLEAITSDADLQASAIARRFAARIDSDIASGPNEPVFAVVASGLEGLLGTVRKATGLIVDAGNRFSKEVAEQEKVLAGRQAKQEIDYRDVVEQSRELASRAEERAKVQRQLLETTTARKELETRDKERRARMEVRRKLLDKLSTLRNQRYEARKRIAQMLTGSLEGIKVTIIEGGDRTAYEEILIEELKQKGLRGYTHLVNAIVNRVSPTELVEWVIENDAKELADHAELREEQAARAVEILRESEKLYDIETVDLLERPVIELLDGETYKTSDELSTGQRCTTILPILLLENDRPLLIDQPEDNLDNKFIFEKVVTALRDAEGKRQLIFVTHNPNLVVSAKAERVFVMEANGKQAWVLKPGTVDEKKKEIEVILEGGAEAFIERQKRYGH